MENLGENRVDEFIDLYDLIQKDELEYIFRGNFTPEIVKTILDLAHVTLDSLSNVFKIKKRVYYIVGESLQNITRHSSEIFRDSSPDNFSLFAIQKKGPKFYVTTGNVVKEEDIEPLKSRIERINSLEKNDLRIYSRSTRMTTEISPKGGAGIGLIEMAKRSGNKLEYDFSAIDNQYSYFYLNLEIPILNEESLELNEKFSIVNVEELHNILIKENVVLFFKGVFNQATLLNLLTVVENQFKESTISIKIFNLMIEMIQNVSKHGDSYLAEGGWKTGIFLITESDKEYMLISGNYILNTKVKILGETIARINEMTFSELMVEYNKILNDYSTNRKNQGLGLLDIKRKSKSNLTCNFYPVDEEITFLTMQVVVKK